MAQAMTAFVIFMLVAGGIMVSLNRRTRIKMKEAAIGDEAVEPATTPRSLSKRQQRMVATLQPEPELPSIEDLVAEEAAETGVNDIPGGEGLDVSLKLRVYWRDEVVRKGCSDGVLEFRITDGVEPGDAETDDVRLVCVRSGQVADTNGSDQSAASNDSAPQVDPGNFEAGLDAD